MKLLPFNDYDLKTSRIFESLNEASRALAELKGFASSIPNQHILINAITINEAKDSSAIENIVTTHDSIYKVLTQSGFKEAAAKEVVDYRSAIWHGYEIINEKGFISTNILVEIQAIIEPNKTGIRKTPGTNLVNSITDKVIYTPPQQESEIRDLLKNLEDYINLKLGFRSKYIYDFVKNINEEDINKINELDTISAIKYLTSFNGIGLKIASCILLFGYKRLDVFPIDTWVKKYMMDNYGFADINKIKEYATNKYGEYSGLAIQYMFHSKRNKALH